MSAILYATEHKKSTPLADVMKGWHLQAIDLQVLGSRLASRYHRRPVNYGWHLQAKLVGASFSFNLTISPQACKLWVAPSSEACGCFCHAGLDPASRKTCHFHRNIGVSEVIAILTVISTEAMRSIAQRRNLYKYSLDEVELPSTW